MTQQYKVTCLDDEAYDGTPGARIDASSKRWAAQEDAARYARSVAGSRFPQVELVDTERDAELVREMVEVLEDAASWFREWNIHGSGDEGSIGLHDDIVEVLTKVRR